MEVVIRYFFESKTDDELKAVNDYFLGKEMKSEIGDGTVVAEYEFDENSDEPIEVVCENIIIEDFHNLLQILGKNFLMNGVIDTSLSAGELMNFSIEIQNETSKLKASDWYIETAMDSYESYEDFRENFYECTEEEYERFSDCEFVYLIEGKNGDYLSDKVLLEKE